MYRIYSWWYLKLLCYRDSSIIHLLMCSVTYRLATPTNYLHTCISTTRIINKTTGYAGAVGLILLGRDTGFDNSSWVIKQYLQSIDFDIDWYPCPQPGSLFVRCNFEQRAPVKRHTDMWQARKSTRWNWHLFSYWCFRRTGASFGRNVYFSVEIDFGFGFHGESDNWNGLYLESDTWFEYWTSVEFYERGGFFIFTKRKLELDLIRIWTDHITKPQCAETSWNYNRNNSVHFSQRNKRIICG